MGGGTGGPRLGTNGAVSGVTWPSPRPESPENYDYYSPLLKISKKRNITYYHRH